MHMRADGAIRDHHETCEDRSDLIEIKLPRRNPKLGVDRLRDHKVEGSFPHLLGNLVERKKQRLENRVHEEARRGENKRIASAPSRHRVRIAVYDQQDQDKKSEPDNVLSDLGKEVRSELQLPRKRAGKKRSIDLPVPPHRGSLQGRGARASACIWVADFSLLRPSVRAINHLLPTIYHLPIETADPQQGPTNTVKSSLRSNNEVALPCPMKILVPIKRVVDPYAKVRPLPDGSGIDTAGLKFEINPFDEIAVEEAVRLKERDASTEIIAITIGGSESEDQLRKALAMGADKAILIENSAPLDSTVVAAELAAAAADIKPDLILMGKQATDDDNNQAGQMLAAKLDWPQATFAAKIERSEGVVKVTRETDTGAETLELPLPAVVTTDLRLNEPRYIALPGIIKARSKPLERKQRYTNAAAKTRVTKMQAPPARQAGKKVGSVDELVAALKERGAL